MFSIILICFAILSILLDFFIYRTQLRKRKPLIKYAYTAQAVIINIGALLSIIFAKSIIGSGNSDSMVMVSWLMLIFLMSFFPKFIFILSIVLQIFITRISGHNLKFIKYIGFCIAVSILGLMGYGSTIGRSQLRVERVVIESDQIPDEFNGFTIAHFSDIHIGNLGSWNPIIEKMVLLINSLNPDIVINSGDLVNMHSKEITPQIKELLAQIKAPVYSVLGNHDLGVYLRDSSIISQQGTINKLIDIQTQLGWTVLNNSNILLRKNNDSIFIAGNNYPKSSLHRNSNPNFEGGNLLKTMKSIPDSTFSILISHTPNSWDSIPNIVNPNLTVSGHTHAMQAKISIGDWQFSPAQWLYPQYSGLYRRGDNYLYVNDGIGYVLYPMRVGTKPEITLYVLRKSSK